MSIKLVGELSAAPNPIPLPAQVTLSQVLACVGPDAETADIRYSLEPSHNVWFLESTQAPRKTKEAEREAIVNPSGTSVTHVVRLVEGDGNGPMDVVEVTETIVDKVGRERRRVVLLSISR